ncbi:MAG: ABC transporter permease [Firmicutes bacterium HGW-Firmicutes-9]|jgi:NitT/TauT family transport system permease protein|nr:MAG: ABC transporter permease [Firmicutes bacterium HGW-Firmicutes-9]
MKQFLKRLLSSQLAGFIGFLFIWQILHLLLKTHTIPSPLETLAYFVSVPLVLLKHTGASVLRVSAAVGISLVLGIPAGLLLGVNKTCKRLFSPLLYFIYPIPKIAFLPVFMLLFGLGNPSKIMLILFIIVFQIMLSMRDGVSQIDPVYFKVMDSFCVSQRQQYRYLIFPAVLPYLFSGLRISIGISLASLFFAENYATQFGIGYYILSAWTKMNYVEMFSGILALGFVGILLFYLLDRLERLCVPWQKQNARN